MLSLFVFAVLGAWLKQHVASPSSRLVVTAVAVLHVFLGGLLEHLFLGDVVALRGLHGDEVLQVVPRVNNHVVQLFLELFRLVLEDRAYYEFV